MRPRIFMALALLSASICWLGAISPSLLPPPLVVVYPLTVNGDAQKDSGERLAVMFAQQLSDNGIKVVPPVPGTERIDYLTSARKLGCDYYVTGFITPLGAEVSVVEQIVSTSSGTVVASNSVQFLTYSDANGQGSLLGQMIHDHAERALASLQENPQPSATAEPKESPGASLDKLGGLFKKRAKATPAPTVPPDETASGPTPTPSPTATGITIQDMEFGPQPGRH
ncbi:MAG: hypothetical protein ABSE64_14790 [Vulcanimicrobiaceae bacterium]